MKGDIYGQEWMDRVRDEYSEIIINAAMEGRMTDKEFERASDDLQGLYIMCFNGVLDESGFRKRARKYEKYDKN